MSHVFKEAIDSPAAWKGSELSDDRAFVTPLTQADLSDIDRALAYARECKVDWQKMSREDFPIDAFAQKLGAMERELRHGKGFVLLRGLPVQRYPAGDLLRLWMGIGVWLGQPVSQNAQGELISPVTDGGKMGEDASGRLVSTGSSLQPGGGNPDLRLYKTRAELRPHNDSADLVGLLCVHPAKTGGVSTIISAISIYNEILATAPEHLVHLFNGYHYDVRGEGTTGRSDEVTAHRIPVFSYFEGLLSCRFNPKTIESAQRKMKQALPAQALQAVAYMEDLAKNPKLRIDMELQAGDMQFLNNLFMLHYRTEFEDWPQPERKRLLLRLWLNLRNGPALAPEFSNRYNAGARSGVPVRA